MQLEVVSHENQLWTGSYQFLYKDDMGYNIMNTETYDQMAIEESLFNSPQFLKDGDIVELVSHADTETPLFVELAPNTVLEITYTEPGVKGDTATNATKPATIETGAEVHVPLFINIGELIKVDTVKKCYLERVKRK